MNINNLKSLLRPWIKNIPHINIKNLVMDSRELTEGDVFVSIPGTKKDGRDFILDAIEKKSSAILCDTKKKRTWKMENN